MVKYTQTKRPRLIPHALKVILIIIGIIAILGGLFLFIGGIVYGCSSFKDAVTQSCQSYTCITTRNGNCALSPYPLTLDFSWVKYSLAGFILIIVGTIMLAIGTNSQSKKTFKKIYPNAVFCEKCDTFFDKRDGYCPKCGEPVEKNNNEPVYSGEVFEELEKKDTVIIDNDTEN